MFAVAFELRKGEGTCASGSRAQRSARNRIGTGIRGLSVRGIVKSWLEFDDQDVVDAR